LLAGPQELGSPRAAGRLRLQGCFGHPKEAFLKGFHISFNTKLEEGPVKRVFSLLFLSAW